MEVADPLPWPRGLPDPIEKPGGYVELDPALAAAVAERMGLADEWPTLCRAHVDAQRDLDAAWAEGNLRVAHAEADARVAEVEARTLAWWEAALVAGGALLAGGLAGFAVGAVWSGGF